MIWDRLGVLTDEVSGHMPEALDWIAEQGLKHVEIRTVEGRNVMDTPFTEISEIRSLVEKRGLFVSALASPVFKCALNPSRSNAIGDTFGQREESVEEHFRKLAKAFKVAKLLGTDRIRIFSFWREKNPEAHREEIFIYLRRAAAMAEQEKMLLMLENEPACNGGFANEVAQITAMVDSQALKILWDPGNEYYGGKVAFPDGFNFVKDQLVHVHLKDAAVSVDGNVMFVPIGQGEVPYGRQLRALQQHGYNGLFTIETHFIPQGKRAMDGTLATLQGLRELIHQEKLE